MKKMLAGDVFSKRIHNATVSLLANSRSDHREQLKLLQPVGGDALKRNTSPIIFQLANIHEGGLGATGRSEMPN